MANDEIGLEPLAFQRIAYLEHGKTVVDRAGEIPDQRIGLRLLTARRVNELAHAGKTALAPLCDEADGIAGSG